MKTKEKKIHQKFEQTCEKCGRTWMAFQHKIGKCWNCHPSQKEFAELMDRLKKSTNKAFHFEKAKSKSGWKLIVGWEFTSFGETKLEALKRALKED